VYGGDCKTRGESNKTERVIELYFKNAKGKEDILEEINRRVASSRAITVVAPKRGFHMEKKKEKQRTERRGNSWGNTGRKAIVFHQRILGVPLLVGRESCQLFWKEGTLLKIERGTEGSG